MSNDSIALHPACREFGQLICKDIGYALHRSDGEDVWLEMDAIPQHLIEREVVIAWRRYGRNLIWVDSIGPAIS